MLKKLNAEIQVANLTFPYANSVRIERTWKNLTATAKVELPRNLKLKGKSLKERISKGDRIVIKLGYKPDLVQEFRGYVTSVQPKQPFVIEAEDEMWKLKQTNINKSFEEIQLPALVNDIVPGNIETNVKDVALGPYRIKNASVAKVLRNVREQYGIQSFFRGNTLVCGFAYPDEPVEVNYHMQRNVVDNINLAFRGKNDVKIKVEAISMKPDNSKEEVTVGDEDGEVRTLHFYNLSKSELKNRAEEKLDELKVAGYRGSFEAYGQPYVDHGYLVNLTDRKYPEREGAYYVDRVVTRYGNNGFRRTVELGKQA